MGFVYKAQDERLNRCVALKFLPPHLGTREDAKRRFLTEARAAARLDHPNICTIHEIGETSDGQFFISMPLYEGETLQQRLERTGALSFADAANIALQIAAGLAKAHEQGIVHRDVKPSNIILLADGGVKILDFGIARVDDALLATHEGGALGTLAYMSPEQAQGEQSISGPTSGRLASCYTKCSPASGRFKATARAHCFLQGGTRRNR